MKERLKPLMSYTQVRALEGRLTTSDDMRGSGERLGLLKLFVNKF